MPLVPSEMVTFVILRTRCIDALEVSATIEASLVQTAVDVLLETLVDIFNKQVTQLKSVNKIVSEWPQLQCWSASITTRTR